MTKKAQTIPFQATGRYYARTTAERRQYWDGETDAYGCAVLPFEVVPETPPRAIFLALSRHLGANRLQVAPPRAQRHLEHGATWSAPQPQKPSPIVVTTPG